MNELTPIRKIIEGINVNTDTANIFHLDVKVITEQSNGKLVNRHIIQGLYRNHDNGQYFLAFWNKPKWNDETLSYDFIEDIFLINSDKAKQWVMNYCPEKLKTLIASMSDHEKLGSFQTLTLRLPIELKNHLAFLAKVSDVSINKICINFINAGILAGSIRGSVLPPATYEITMPDGRPVLDNFGKALKFEDFGEQALAGYAESLYDIFNFNPPSMLPFVLQTIYRLKYIVKNESYLLLFVNWLSQFHRVNSNDANYSHEQINLV